MSNEVNYKFVDMEVVLALAPSYEDKDFFAIELDSEPFNGWLVAAEIGEEKDGYLNFECSVIGTPHDVNEEYIQKHYEEAIKLVEKIIIKTIADAAEKFETKS